MRYYEEPKPESTKKLLVIIWLTYFNISMERPNHVQVSCARDSARVHQNGGKNDLSTFTCIFDNFIFLMFSTQETNSEDEDGKGSLLLETWTMGANQISSFLLRFFFIVISPFVMENPLEKTNQPCLNLDDAAYLTSSGGLKATRPVF